MYMSHTIELEKEMSGAYEKEEERIKSLEEQKKFYEWEHGSEGNNDRLALMVENLWLGTVVFVKDGSEKLKYYLADPTYWELAEMKRFKSLDEAKAYILKHAIKFLSGAVKEMRCEEEEYLDR